jgi:hypothetical protein
MSTGPASPARLHFQGHQQNRYNSLPLYTDLHLLAIEGQNRIADLFQSLTLEVVVDCAEVF